MLPLIDQFITSITKSPVHKKVWMGIFFSISVCGAIMGGTLMAIADDFVMDADEELEKIENLTVESLE